MEDSEIRRAIKAAVSTASALNLQAGEAAVIHNSNRIAVRLIPGEVLARVGPAAQQASFEFEAEVAWRLAEAGGPVAELEPRAGNRVYVRDGFAISLWAYHEPAAPEITPHEYAAALRRLHAAFRRIDLEVPSLTQRIAGAQSDISDQERTPALSGPDRELLATTLSRLSWSVSRGGAGGQLLHGEPHPGNLLSTSKGPLFVDLETCCRGPVEFDLAFAPEEAAEHYPGADPGLINQCRILMWALFATWRWDRDDQLPNGAYWRTEGLNQLRASIDRYGLG